MKNEAQIIGWREVVSLPLYGLTKIKAKMDTGAKTSALHAEDIKIFESKGKKYVSFTLESDTKKKLFIKSKLIDERIIKNSTGHSTLRPVIQTKIKIGDEITSIEVTLINRDLMGFKMLIGREALKGKFIINPARSYLLGVSL